jgi:hypothetical protein
MKKAVSRAAITFAAGLTCGALAYVNYDNPAGAVGITACVAVVMAFLSLAADSE